MSTAEQPAMLGDEIPWEPKVCRHCDRLLSRDRFRRYRYGWSTVCIPCRNDEVLARQAKARAPVNDYKTARGCMDCGWNEHPEALDLDHRPGEQKVDDIARMVSSARPPEEIMAEVAKCDVVCARCHRLRTIRRREASR